MKTLFLLLASFPLWGACLGSFTQTSAGVCTGTVGQTARNYTTMALALADVPSDLTAAGNNNSYVISLYQDGTGTNGEFTCTGTCVTIPAKTTDSTHTLTFTAAAGQSFQDNASVRSNALRYNKANGVAINKTDDFGSLFLVNGAVDYLIITRLQLSKNATSSGGVIINEQANSNHGLFKDLIVNHQGSSGAVFTLLSGSSTTPQWINVLAVQKNNSAVTCFDIQGGNPQILASGCAKIGTAGGTAFARAAGSPTLVDSYSFGFTTASSGTFGTSNNNATEQSSITGTSNQTLVAYSTSTFTNITSTTEDYRVPNGSGIIGFATRDLTNAPLDISGSCRPSSPTIGPWENNPCIGSVRHRIIRTGGL